MLTGGLNNIFKTILDNSDEGILKQELISLLKKIENDATEIYHAKYGLDDRIRFNIGCYNTHNTNLMGRQSVKSLECIRQSVRKNLGLMNEEMKIIFQSYLNECRE